MNENDKKTRRPKGRKTILDIFVPPRSPGGGYPAKIQSVTLQKPVSHPLPGGRVGSPLSNGLTHTHTHGHVSILKSRSKFDPDIFLGGKLSNAVCFGFRP